MWGLALGLVLPGVLLWALWTYSPDAGATGAIALIVVCELLMVWNDSRIKTPTPKEAMIGQVGAVAYPFSRDNDDIYRGNVQIGVESWTASADQNALPRLSAGRKVKVTGINGLVLHVVPYED